MNISYQNLTYEDPTNSTNILLWPVTPMDIFMYIFNVLFGFPTHCYVLWLTLSGTGSGVAIEFFNVNPSVCEIGISLEALSSVLLYIGELKILVRLTWFLWGLLITGRPLSQCLLCVERYLAVVHPVTFLKYKPLRYRLIGCIPVWMIIFSSCLCSMMSADRSDFRFFIYFYLSQFLLFLVIQLFCLVAVLRALKQSGPREQRKENLMKRRAFQLVLITTISLCVVYMPLVVAGFTFIVSHVINVYLFSFGYFTFILGGFVQPLLNLHQMGKFSCLSSTLK